ncbi:hypothetical protein KP509_04G070800 [Ceratopteris richardii]|uniref:Uncharacterized protein n=1 Tax=Ceratopteris richardii TaxID=49495 RepID=A0A8T2UXY4_CERRI|nr:hypothetical protein KP509_04G070800 [Ceratopteris richardii]
MDIGNNHMPLGLYMKSMCSCLPAAVHQRPASESRYFFPLLSNT